MEKTIFGIIAIVAGFALMIFKERFVRDSIKFQNKTFGFHFGEEEVKKKHSVRVRNKSGFYCYGCLDLVRSN